MDNFLSAIKKYFTGIVIGIIIAGLFVISKFQSCSIITPNNKVPTPVVTLLKTRIPTALERTYVPNNETVVAAADLRPVRAPIGTVATTTVIVSAACTTCTTHVTQVTTFKKYIGFDFTPKAFIGYTDGSISVGYDQGIFRYGKYTFDALLTIPSVGLAFSRNITNNFSILAGANYKYISATEIKDPTTYRFNSISLNSVYPVIGVSFNF